MDRPSISTEQLAEVRIELNDLATHSEWRHRVVMSEFADLHEAISRRQSLMANLDWSKALPIILALAMPVLVLLATGSPQKALEAAATASSLPGPK